MKQLHPDINRGVVAGGCPSADERKGGGSWMAGSSEGSSAQTAKPTLSRRAALKRFGEFGLAATAGVGLLELVGIRGAGAQTTGPPSTVPGSTTVPGRPGEGTAGAGPNVTCATGYCKVILAPDHCPTKCPSGYWCYSLQDCGIDGYQCLVYAGSSYCIPSP